MKRITSQGLRAMTALGAAAVLGACLTTYTEADLDAREARQAETRRAEQELSREIGEAGGEALSTMEEDREEMGN